jgi:glucose/arabinose dehydrogenase
MRRAAVFALQLLIVAIAVVAGAQLASEVRIIPKALLHLPQIDFGADDITSVLIAYLVACTATFAANRLLNGWAVFDDGRRTAKEIYALVTGIVAAALYLFFLTAIVFSPELVLQSTLIALLLFVGVHWLATRRVMVAELFGLLKSPWSWLVVLFALSPIAVARQFAADRDFANWVTNIRVAANVSSDHPYVLVNALGTTTFETPIFAAFAPGDGTRIFTLTRSGKLYVTDYPTGANSRLLLDLTPKVGYVEMENGALGLALHPQFAQPGSPNAGLAYVYYTAYRPTSQTNHLTRYNLLAGSPDAVLASAQPLIEQGRNNDGYHNAGSVGFGPEGFLYLTVGEASNAKCHQRVDCALVGGVLRLDVDQRGGATSSPIRRQPENGRTANYFIPNDNPYAADPGKLGEFWAHGLRNPFRLAFDPENGTGWMGEVGSTTWEEVNKLVKGGNYQFPYIEGTTPQPNYPKPATITGTEVPPVLTYKHTAYLRSVIGGIVYRGSALPKLAGHYVYGDNYSGELMKIPATASRADKLDVIARVKDVAQRGFTGLVEAPDGNLLVVVMGDNDRPTGIIGKLVPSDSDAAKAAPVAAPAPATKVTAEQAKILYNTNCARCHGVTGKGDGPDSKDLGEYVPNFTDPNFHKWRSDAEIVAALRGGGMAVGRGSAMPPWEGVLTNAEMVAVKDHVRRFQGK